MRATPRSFGASPTESCNLLSLLPVGVGDDLGLGDRLRLLWRRSGRGGSPQRRGLGPRPPPALEYQEQSEDNHYDQGAVEKGLDWFLVVNATVLLLARAAQFLSTRAVTYYTRFLLQQTARVDLPTTVAHVERGRVRRTHRRLRVPAVRAPVVVVFQRHGFALGVHAAARDRGHAQGPAHAAVAVDRGAEVQRYLWRAGSFLPAIYCRLRSQVP